MSEQAQQPERREQFHLVSSAGHPNFGDEFITASWLRFLANQRPDAEVVLHSPDPGLATYLLDGLHPKIRHTNLLWRVAWDTMEMDPDTGDAYVDRVVTDLGTPATTSACSRCATPRPSTCSGAATSPRSGSTTAAWSARRVGSRR
ncbi:polysaccharide pyruvyl transferase family protein [Nocardioides sp. TF02-7]|uniref:polysaccharide pyruvyl transferase family protein n=1 Tax=Nocardioides sp. TF02-7 TaxID=2917724 RepID=UPI001F0587FF|nr:polysaccharide pyruvyl transferase family protein [Nocardioides sp. TF02-7]UMG93202.1 polysaccharide pyruvyl transferase family protein [Nocardioides sp. TF02-7]